jgi:LysR family transcriptional regulator, glycine cleavage system transcriptional activator
MTSLRAFEAVARLLSFTRASRELNLTQTAVSHQIKNLEELFGLRLFVREHGTVKLTDPAHELLESLRPLIVEVGQATARARDRKNDMSLYVGSMATFALKWLIPRLSDFRQQNPDIEIRLGTVVSTEGLTRRDYDVTIRYGPGDWPGFVSEKLYAEEVFPVCSPALLRRGPRLKKPSDLSRHNIIQTDHSFIIRDDWPHWLAQAGVPDMEFSKKISFDLLFPAIEAALAGLGVAMGRTPLINDALDSGALVEPFDIRFQSEAAYYVSSPKERAQLKNVIRFRTWLLSCFAESPKKPLGNRDKKTR